MRRTVLGLALIAVSLPVGGGCDKGGQEQTSSGPTYTAHCDITIESQGEETPLRYEGSAQVQEAAEAAAWETTCTELGLPAGCREALPEGLRYDGIMCMRLTVTEGTGIEAEGVPEFNCTVNLQDRRSIRRAEAAVERTGSRDELDNYSDELCVEAIAQACSQLGAEGDCTAGDAPAFSVTSRSAGRQLGNR